MASTRSTSPQAGPLLRAARPLDLERVTFNHMVLDQRGIPLSRARTRAGQGGRRATRLDQAHDRPPLLSMGQAPYPITLPYRTGC